MGRRDGPFFFITASSSISHPFTVGDLRKSFDPLCLYEASAIKARTTTTTKARKAVTVRLFSGLDNHVMK